MNYTFSKSTESMRSSAIRDLMSLATRPDIISFAGGMPGNDLFPVDDLREMVATLPVSNIEKAMQYGETAGNPDLIAALKDYLRKQGMPVDTNRIMITTGSLQALYIFGKIFINHGDTVLTENPSFVGALSAFKSFQAKLQGVNIDVDGICIEQLKKKLAANPKFLYITPNFHNPAGIVYSRERRVELLKTMSGTNIPIIEDDAYGQLYFNDNLKPILQPLKTFTESEQQVLYSGSFSKIFGPGLRLGWMLVPPEVYQKAEVCKQSIDACTPTLSQALALEFMTSGRMEKYIQKLRLIYRERCNCMIDALRNELPAEAEFVEPQGGFYIWVKLPQGIDEKKLLLKTIERGAVYVVGSTFEPNGDNNGYLRLSFSNTSPEQIKKGIRILGKSIKEIQNK